MTIRKTTKLIRVANYVAEMPAELTEDETGWSPYFSLEDARKLDAVRLALRRGDVEATTEAAGPAELFVGKFYFLDCDRP